jgi:hypothetical protein
MNRFALSVIVTLAWVSRSIAAESSSPPPAPLEIKNKSSFTMENNGRNPFWPIGWKPLAKVSDPGVEKAGPDLPVTAFAVSSITIEQNARFAIINSKIMQEGQQFGLQLGNQTYQITVKSIQDGRVILARRDQEIVVPLRRK